MNLHPGPPFMLLRGDYRFPDPELAMDDPNGLLCIGGDLSAERLLAAYERGIFPWYSDGQPILWWTPNPRAVLFPDELKISRSLRKTLRKGEFEVTLDNAFSAVIDGCATPRDDGLGTWITREMKRAYETLHDEGYAHSVECWYQGELVGGLYGVALGGVFYGESMFSRMSDASKVAFVHLVQQLKYWNFAVIDCQVGSAHLFSLGAREIGRESFMVLLQQHRHEQGHIGHWQLLDTIKQAVRQ